MKDYTVVEELKASAASKIEYAFERGYEQGFKACHSELTEEEAKAHYNTGYEDGKKEVAAELNFEKGYDKGYSVGYEDAYGVGKKDGQDLQLKETECAEACGMQRAWDVARKIVDLCSELTQEELGEIFGSFDVNDIFNGLSASEAVEKIEAWEKKQDAPEVNVDSIGVGDEVWYLNPKFNCVVINIYDGDAFYITKLGFVGRCEISKLHKTGNHYNIKDILDKMKDHEVKE